MNIWYAQLIKPVWAPPAAVFGPVWTVLYTGIIITFGSAAMMYIKGKIPFVVLLPFLLNVCFNLMFTYIQFELKHNILASVDILLVLSTLIWFMIAIFPYAKWIAYANIPYLCWVAFATVLQLSITYLNI